MSSEYHKAAKALNDLSSFIQYCQDTKENEWVIDVVRTKGNEKNCLFGHLVNWYYGKNYEGNISPIWDMFEEIWTSTFVVYPINDGKDLRYQQSTPKQRCIAYLKDLWLGFDEPVYAYMERMSKQ